MLKVKEKSLDWALKNIEKFGDTDIFPVPFEYEAIRYDWENNLRKYLRDRNLLEWDVRSLRRSLTPKNKFGYRLSTQLDPLDNIIFNSLVYEIGEDIEKSRIPKNEEIVFSNRFSPDDDGIMFDTDYTWLKFQNKSLEHINNGSSYVVVADIADFYPRIYHHPLENALEMCTNKNNHTKKITNMLNKWNHSISYGIPVGPSGPMLLAELAIDDVDRALLSDGAVYCRYVDDYRIFCESKLEAYNKLSYLANILFENHGLTLQQSKTKIMTANEFKKEYLKTENSRELDNLSKKFYDILERIGIQDMYQTIEYDELDEDIQNEIDMLNLNDILEEQIENENIDSKLVAFVLNRLGQMDNSDSIELIFSNIDKLYTVFKNIFIYINNLDCLNASDKSHYGGKLLEVIDESIVGHLEYHRAWVFNVFANDFEWNNKSEYINLYNTYSDDFSRRKLILALGKSNTYHWFKTNKRNIQSFNPWLKRAFLAGASCLPGDEAKHWYRSINRRLDPLENAITRWAKNNF